MTIFEEYKPVLGRKKEPDKKPINDTGVPLQDRWLTMDFMAELVSKVIRSRRLVFPPYQDERPSKDDS